MRNGYFSDYPIAFAALAGPTRRRAIDRLLRDYFDGLRGQPIPDAMRILIDRLGGKRGPGGGCVPGPASPPGDTTD